MNTPLRALDVNEEEAASSCQPFERYIRLSCLAQRPVALKFTDRGHIAGRIVIVDGRIWHAEDRHGTGVPAFIRCAASNFDIRVEPLTQPFGTRTITRSWLELLQEAGHYRDSAPAPPLPSRSQTSHNNYARTSSRPQSLEEATKVITAAPKSG